jgi:hypothetical protein
MRPLNAPRAQRRRAEPRRTLSSAKACAEITFYRPKVPRRVSLCDTLVELTRQWYSGGRTRLRRCRCALCCLPTSMRDTNFFSTHRSCKTHTPEAGARRLAQHRSPSDGGCAYARCSSDSPNSRSAAMQLKCRRVHDASMLMPRRRPVEPGLWCMSSQSPKTSAAVARSDIWRVQQYVVHPWT